jgi:hypothetical protein
VPRSSWASKTDAAVFFAFKLTNWSTSNPQIQRAS